jgi:XTP/dITP diphosphohydrolase
LLVATTNAGKVREIRLALAGLRVSIGTLQDVPPLPEPDESGVTFAENAALKARAYARHTGLSVVAEDSGLVVDALGGRPGVHSARYPGATYPEKFARLYEELAACPRPWSARYICSVAVALPSEETGGAAISATAEASVDGEIWPAPLGTNGFGYDPIFYYPPFGRTFGELSDEAKLSVSHRGRAFRALAARLARDQVS